jgi:hypothetical protein
MSRTNAPWGTSTFRRWDASRDVAAMGRRGVQIQADGGHAEPTRIACDFSAADSRRDAHADMRHEAQRQTRPRRRSKLQVLARARIGASSTRPHRPLRHAARRYARVGHDRECHAMECAEVIYMVLLRMSRSETARECLGPTVKKKRNDLYISQERKNHRVDRIV